MLTTNTPYQGVGSEGASGGGGRGQVSFFIATCLSEKHAEGMGGGVGLGLTSVSTFSPMSPGAGCPARRTSQGQQSTDDRAVKMFVIWLITLHEVGRNSLVMMSWTGRLPRPFFQLIQSRDREERPQFATILISNDSALNAGVPAPRGRRYPFGVGA